MGVLLIVSISVLTAALLASIVVLVRSGEARIALVTVLLALLGIQQGVALYRQWDQPLGFDIDTGAALAGLAASLLGLFAVLAFGRTLRELDRAEILHWESMEGVRGLTQLAGRRAVELEERLPLLLEIGCERFGLEIGLVSRIRSERYEVTAIHAPDDFPITRGAAFSLSETYCRHTLEAQAPVAVSRAADDQWAEHPARAAFRFQAYLGTAIRVGDEPIGTLVFASLQPRAERFTATHKELLQLMAQWIAFETEGRQRRAGVAARARPARSSALWRPSGERREPAGLQLNPALRRLEKRIRRTAGSNIDVALELAPELEPARPLRVPIDAIVLSLVDKAVEAMPDGGKLVVSTASHRAAGGDPGVLPAVAPDHYITLSVQESGGAVDADALARIFERDESDAAAPGNDGRLPLATLYRMLQRAGGDLSVEVEPGKGSRFTVFLPLARPQPRAARAPAPRRAAAPPPLG